MKLTHELHQLLTDDSRTDSLPEFFLSGSISDPNHTKRRMQQRAISTDMIELALLYGKQEYYSHAKTYTILDKTLKNTPYQRFVDKLRGLRVIALETARGLKVTSVYWAWNLR